MNFYPAWQYDEMRQVGTDYTDDANVKAYDNRMQKLMDIEKENQSIIEILDPGKNQTILDLGTGTGSFAVEAAKHCAKVFAVDVSPQMLEFAKQKAMKDGVNNIEFHNADSSHMNTTGNLLMRSFHNWRCTTSRISGK